MYISYKSVLIDAVTGFDNRNKYKDHITFLCCRNVLKWNLHKNWIEFDDYLGNIFVPVGSWQFFKRFHLKSVAICGMKDDIVTGMKNEHKMTNKDILVEHRVKCNELELKNLKKQESTKSIQILKMCRVM